jgi:hypothetical protein
MTSRIATMSICSILILGVAAVIVVSVKMQNRGSSDNVNSVDPCWFQSVEGIKSVSEEIRTQRRERDSSGYAVDIPLGDAVRIFNAEMSCFPDRATLPSLTVGELLAALTTPPDYGAYPGVWRMQRDVVAKIQLTGTLPKGSLLVGEADATVLNASGESGNNHASGVRIYLFLHLDETSRFDSPPPENIILIRKLFTGLH